MAHNVFVNEHIVMLADSFTRKRAMHINIAKVIFSVENTTLSLCFLITLTLASPEMIYKKKAGTSSQRFLLYGCY